MNDSRPCLFTTPDLGLANRLRGLVALWAHAKKNKRPLHVLWTPSDACPYRIEDMFEPLSDTTYIQTQEPSDTYSLSSSDLGHLSHSLPQYGISYAMAPLLIASLVPVASLRDRIRAIALSVPLSNAIGLHVRATDHTAYRRSTCWMPSQTPTPPTPSFSRVTTSRPSRCFATGTATDSMSRKNLKRHPPPLFVKRMERMPSSTCTVWPCVAPFKVATFRPLVSMSSISDRPGPRAPRSSRRYWRHNVR